jgi:hypothetical protein
MPDYSWHRWYGCRDANAIYHVTCIRVRDLPIALDKL